MSTGTPECDTPIQAGMMGAQERQLVLVLCRWGDEAIVYYLQHTPRSDHMRFVWFDRLGSKIALLTSPSPTHRVSLATALFLYSSRTADWLPQLSAGLADGPLQRLLQLIALLVNSALEFFRDLKKKGKRKRKNKEEEKEKKETKKEKK